LTDEHLEQLRKGFAGLQRQPNFDALRKRKTSAKRLASKVRDLEDSLDEVAFAIRQAGRKVDAVSKAQKACVSLRQHLTKLPDTAPVLAEIERDAADILERAWTTGQRVADRGKYLPTDLPAVFRHRFVSLDGKGLAVFANPAGNIWDAATARQFSDDVRKVDPEASGMAVNIHEHQRMIREGFTRAGFIAAGLVLIVLLVGFRKVGDALLALIPVLVGFLWMLGLMGAFRIPFDIANVVCVPLTLGIGIDAGAHMVHRWRHSALQHGGVGELGEIIRGTGAAVLLASLTTALGFAALMTGDYGAMKTVGLVMTIGIGCCLVASLVVLPAILVVLRKAR